MFYNKDLLSKRGALAHVWVASHLSSKLSKSLLLNTSISNSVRTILNPGNQSSQASTDPLSLRLTGQLLFGVVRIYQKQTKYLLDDCNEVLSRVRQAFSGKEADKKQITLKERDPEAITLRPETSHLDQILDGADDFLWGGNQFDFSVGLVSAKRKKTTVASVRDITLNEPYLHDAGTTMDWDMPIGGDDVEAFDLGLDSESGFDEFDTGLASQASLNGKKRRASMMDQDADERSSQVASVEIGRDASAALSERASARAPSINGSGLGTDALDAPLDDMQYNFGDENVNQDYMDVGGFDVPEFNASDIFRDAGRGSDYGDFGFAKEGTPAGTDLASLQLSPQTAADLAKRAAIGGPSAKRQKTIGAVGFDDVTELEDIDHRNRRAVVVNRVEPSYLPGSKLDMYFLNSSKHPMKSLLTILDKADSKGKQDQTTLYDLAPLGIPEEFRSMFTMPSRRDMIRAEGRERQETPASVEVGRERGSSVYLGAEDDVFRDIGGDDAAYNFGDQEGGDDFQTFDQGGFEIEALPSPGSHAEQIEPTEKEKKEAKERDRRERREREPRNLALDEEGKKVSEGPLRIFDLNSMGGSSLAPTQSQIPMGESLGAESEAAFLVGDEEADVPMGKWSKNTMKAVKVLREELTEDHEKPVQWSELSVGATKKAAATMFFELLVLGTRDCLKLQQSESYGDILVNGRERLWDGNIPAITV